MQSPGRSAPTFTEQARRAQILDAAVRCVNEIGYHRTSLAEIATRAGVAKSAVVYYFGGRDAVLLRLMEDAFVALGDDVLARVQAAGPPLEQLRAYVEASVDHVDQHRAAITAALGVAVGHRDADGRPIYLSGDQDEDTVLLREILAAGMADGVFRTLPLTLAAALVTALVDHAMTAVQLDAAADLTDLRRYVVDFTLRSVVTSPA